MIRLDLTTPTVTVEGDGAEEHFFTVRAMQRGDIPASVRRFVPDVQFLEEAVRTRSGDQVLCEYDITESGVYELRSACIGSLEQRYVELGVEFLDKDSLQLTVLPNSSICSYIVEDTIHYFIRGNTLRFELTVEGRCFHTESEKEDVKKHRATAWERILADDDTELEGGIKLETLFTTKLPLNEPADDEDIGLRDERPGLGFPGERFDLVCPQCGKFMRLRLRRKPPEVRLFYGCSAWPDCDATHGAKRDGSPMGTPGDKETRKARMYAHQVFDRLWEAKEGEKPLMNRHEAYEWLRKEMKLTGDSGHIGSFSKTQCDQLQALVKAKFPRTKTAWDKILDDNLF
jgi:ssDNA-binding Zn-finger/Zn-ribbon topoisomerase 1